MSDPIHHNDGKCHLERADENGLGACGYPVGPIRQAFFDCPTFFRRVIASKRLAAVTFYAVLRGSTGRNSIGWIVLNWRVVTQVIMPEFSWPGMTQLQREHLATLLDELKHHEEGHVTIAQKFVAKLPSWQTGRDLRVGLAKITNEHERALTRLERRYDSVTHNGVTQSKGPSAGFPGGRDVFFEGCY